MEPTPAPAPTEMEPTPTETEPMPAETEPAPTETEPAPTETEPAPTETETEPMPMPAPAPSETTPVAADPETTPFGLGALPVNPVFLVGGAGLLLILLGIVALLRRRRASSEEDDLAEPMGMAAAADSASADDDDFLHELEAVAADLAEDTDAPRRRGAQAALAVDSPDDAGPDAGAGAVTRLDPDRPADKRTARERAKDTETERTVPGMVDEGDDADISFDIDALTDDDFDSRTRADKARDEINLDDPEELSAPVPDPDEDARSDEAAGEPAALTPERDEGAGTPLDEAVPDDAGGPDLEPELQLDEATDDGDTGARSLDDIGEDEIQTKLDLAQVYMEMGDTDSARGFLEAVLADGDTDQRDIAREMLSRLT